MSKPVYRSNNFNLRDRIHKRLSGTPPQSWLEYVKYLQDLKLFTELGLGQGGPKDLSGFEVIELIKFCEDLRLQTAVNQALDAQRKEWLERVRKVETQYRRPIDEWEGRLRNHDAWYMYSDQASTMERGAEREKALWEEGVSKYGLIAHTIWNHTAITIWKRTDKAVNVGLVTPNEVRITEHQYVLVQHRPEIFDYYVALVSACIECRNGPVCVQAERILLHLQLDGGIEK